MKTIQSTLLLILITSLVFSACKKTDAEKEAPVVTISKPAIGQTYMSGDTIYFQGTASDNEELHEGKLEILKSSNDSVLAVKNEFVHAVKNYNFDARFSLPVTAAIDAKARATYEDHDGNLTVKEVAIHLHP